MDQSFTHQTPFTVPDLPYAYDALGPHISAAVMELHHDRHHRAYVDKLNEAIGPYAALHGVSLPQLLRTLDTVPDVIRTTLRNHGGGHYNHSLFWQWMTPEGGGRPDGPLADALNARYGSFDLFVEEFTTKALSVFGSGWVWLQPNMDIITTPNQDSPIMQGFPEPILGLDVWEHAYYLDYKNSRAQYVAAWWAVVNWSYVQERFTAANYAAVECS